MASEWQDTLVSVSVTAGAAVILFVLRAILYRVLDSRCREKHWSFNQLVVRVTRVPSFFWCVALAILLGLRISTVPPRYLSPLNAVIEATLFVSVLFVLSNLGEALVRSFLNKSHSGMASSGLVKGLVRALVFGVGGITLLSHFGVEVGPLLTALGLGGLAFALAFKDTVENMFSGIHLLMDRSVEVGDLIKLESGQEGIVEDIGWRTSKIALDDNAILIIPNMKLAQNITIRKKKNAKATPKKPSIEKGLARA